MSFFNDPSKINPNAEYSADYLADFIRRGQDGHSVREAIAMSVDKMDHIDSQFNNVLDSITGGDYESAPEIRMARGGESNLQIRIDKTETIVSTKEPFLANIWYQDVGRSGLNFSTSSGVSVKNAEVSRHIIDDEEKLWFNN